MSNLLFAMEQRERLAHPHRPPREVNRVRRLELAVGQELAQTLELLLVRDRPWRADDAADLHRGRVHEQRAARAEGEIELRTVLAEQGLVAGSVHLLLLVGVEVPCAAL